MPRSAPAPTSRYEAASLEASRGHFARALELLPPPKAISKGTRPTEIALTAELLHHTGNVSAASRIAELVRSSKPDSTIASRCLAVLGMCAFEAGKLRRSTELLQRAVRAAEEARDPTATCHAMLCLLGRLAGVSPPGSLASLIADTQRLVRTVKLDSLRIRLHLILGRAEGTNGHLDEAEDHFRSAKTLLGSSPNAWLDGLYFLDASTISYLRADFVDGIRLAKQALACAARSGHQRTLAAALSNVGTCHLCLGDYDQAEHHFRKATETNFGSREVRAALLDAYAELELVRGHSDACTRLLDEIETTFPIATGFQASWYQLSPLALRVRLHQSQARWTQSLQCADMGLELAQQRGDRLMVCTFQVLKADTLTSVGDLALAAKVVSEVSPLAASLPLSEAAELSRAKGVLLARLGDVSSGRQHLARAVRVLSVVGSSHALRKAQASLASLAETPTNKRPDQPSAVVDSASVLECSGHPELLGREALALLSRLDCIHGAALVMTSNGRPLSVLARHRWAAKEARAISLATEPGQRITVGESRGRRYYLTVAEKADLLSRDASCAVRRLVETAIEVERHRGAERHQATLTPFEPATTPAGVFLSDDMLKLVAVARRIAASELPVLITGETGTGKEVLARLIHSASDRAEHPFVAFNCTGLSRDTAESQLFGHRRGSFTDAREDASGVIRGVADGTLMLDEIGELDLAIQPKLLRFLESGEVQPVGESKPVTVNVRVIAATNAAIDSRVRDGGFREDLFYRLNVIRLRIPPLRDRREEIPSFVNHFVRRYQHELKRAEIRFSQDALRCLLSYDWPGNVRQLGNEVRRAVAMADSDHTITMDDLSPEIRTSSEYPAPESNGPAPDSHDQEVRVRIDQPLIAAVEQIERAMIGRAIRETGGRVEAAARLLGLSRKGLFLKRRRLGIEIDSVRSDLEFASGRGRGSTGRAPTTEI